MNNIDVIGRQEPSIAAAHLQRQLPHILWLALLSLAPSTAATSPQPALRAACTCGVTYGTMVRLCSPPLTKLFNGLQFPQRCFAFSVRVTRVLSCVSCSRVPESPGHFGMNNYILQISVSSTYISFTLNEGWISGQSS